VLSLLKTTTGIIARDNWMEMGARSQPEAEAAHSSRFYREWGIGNARGRAHALLSVLNDTFGDGAFCGGPTLTPLTSDATSKLAKTPTYVAKAHATPLAEEERVVAEEKRLAEEKRVVAEEEKKKTAAALAVAEEEKE
jgi:hypothetical protein